MKEQNYIVRADRAGVFFGKIKERNGDEITMTDVRRIWSGTERHPFRSLPLREQKNLKIASSPSMFPR